MYSVSEECALDVSNQPRPKQEKKKKQTVPDKLPPLVTTQCTHIMLLFYRPLCCAGISGILFKPASDMQFMHFTPAEERTPPPHTHTHARTHTPPSHPSFPPPHPHYPPSSFTRREITFMGVITTGG